MSIDLERELRAQMQHAPIRPRPGLVREAYRRSRRRARAMRAATTAGVAAVAAATATAVTALGPTRPARPAPETTASLAVHISRALAANQDIMIVRDVTIQPSVYSGTYFNWTYRTSSRQLQDDESGKPFVDQGDTFTRLPDGTFKDVVIRVDYRARTATKSSWVSTPLQPRGLGGTTPTACAVRGGLSGLTLAQTTPDNMASTIRSLLTCDKSVTIGYHQRVGGIEAITITYHYPGDSGTQVLYVNESTYLPFQLVSTVDTGPYRGGGDDFYFSWLPATAGNLAQLTPPIPSGFTVIVKPPQVFPPPIRCGTQPQPVPSAKAGARPRPLPSSVRCGTR